MIGYTVSGIFIFLLLLGAGAVMRKEIIKPKSYDIWILLAVAAVFKIAIAPIVSGYSVDIGCFTAWSEMVFQDGTFWFYSNAAATNSFVDYPPGYMYVLYVIGALRRLFGLETGTGAYLILLKLPAILADLATGYVVYRVAEKQGKRGLGLAACAFFALNPLVYLNSSIWGQVDSIFGLFLLLSFLSLREKRHIRSTIYYAIALLLKPQALVVFPVFLWYISDLFRMRVKGAWKIVLGSVASGLAVFFLLVLPFSGEGNVLWIFELYKNTLSSYPYASLNAFNLFALFGGNGADVSQTFFLFSFEVWSWIFIVATVVCSYFVYRKKEGILLSASFIIISLYILAGKMHERYIFPAMALLLAYAILTGEKKAWLTYGLYSVTIYFGVAYTLAGTFLDPPIYYVASDSPVLILCSLANVAIFVFFVAWIFQKNKTAEKKKTEEKRLDKKREETKTAAEFQLEEAKPKVRYTRVDLCLIALLMVVYSVVAYWNLGDFHAPSTTWENRRGDIVTVDLGSSQHVAQISLFQGQTNTVYEVASSEDGVSWSEPVLTEEDYVFKWTVKDTDFQGRYLRLKNTRGGDAQLNEIAVYGEDEAQIDIVSVKDEQGQLISQLYDEQDIATNQPTYKNGTYFDEIYHVRTAYEHLHGMEPTETTHPPLGKLLIALGIQLFGMNPFGWRFMGTLMGVLMIPMMYLLGKQIFKETKFAFLAAFLLTFDFMHFTQTRIATIDSYGVFFILVMYYFMYRFFETNYNRDPIKQVLRPLFFSGLFFGIGCASKWIDIYAGGGLAVLLFVHIFLRYREYHTAGLGMYHSDPLALSVRKTFPVATVQLLLWCVVFFVVIPLCIYWMSYIPFIFIEGNSYSVGDVFQYQLNIFNYHSNLTATHPYGSYWYQWPIMQRPMWYYNGGVDENGMLSTISAFGNPAIWWVSIPASIFTLWMGIRQFADRWREEKNRMPLKKKAKKQQSIWLSSKVMGYEHIALMLMVGYLSQYIPWMKVSRVVFIYHYFASIPFLILMITYVFYIWRKNSENTKRVEKVALIYMGVVLVLFFLFYPVISGAKAPLEYVKQVLHWFPSWVFYIE